MWGLVRSFTLGAICDMLILPEMLTMTGDMLEHIKGSKPVDVKATAMAMQNFAQQEAQMTSQKGQSPVLWVGSGDGREQSMLRGVGLAMNQVTEKMEAVRF